VRHSNRGRPGKRGFTLIELLVVCAVIVVLAAIVLPALGRAKSSARRVECISRQKQWGYAFITYKEDNEERIPREGYHPGGNVFWNNWAQVQDDRSKDVWYNALERQVGRPAASSYAAPPSRLLFYGRESLFHCPSARLPKAAIYPGYPIALFSIAMNSQLVEPENAPTAKFDQITRPVETVLFLDNLLDDEPRVVEQQAWDNLGQPAATANRFAGVRHGHGGNMVFADGHAGTIAGPKAVQTSGPTRGWVIHPQANIVWDPKQP